MKICKKCSESFQGRACLACQRVRDVKNKANKLLAWNKWRKANPEKRKQQVKAFHLKKLYGLTVAGYTELVERQEGKCKICKTAEGTLVVDHCHGTGKIRGLLCGLCNRLLGHAKDNPEILIKAATYLKEMK